MNNNIPNHVAIILDGNRRWAKEKGKKGSYGHKKGFDNLKELVSYVFNKGIKVLSVYAFSTENFKREKEEVDYLMNLFLKGFKTLEDECNKNNIRIVFSGKKEPLDDKIWKRMKEVEENTKNNDGGIFNVCVNYGGRSEIVDGINKIIESDIKKITEEDFDNYLYNNLPPVDFMIRTSGEERISNFMLWQCAYAEFYFTSTYFPDFDCNEFDKALHEYSKRNRRFGGN